MVEAIAVFILRMVLGGGILWVVFKLFQGIYLVMFMDTAPTWKDLLIIVLLLVFAVAVGYGAFLLGGFVLGLTG